MTSVRQVPPRLVFVAGLRGTGKSTLAASTLPDLVLAYRHSKAPPPRPIGVAWCSAVMAGDPVWPSEILERGKFTYSADRRESAREILGIGREDVVAWICGDDLLFSTTEEERPTCFASAVQSLHGLADVVVVDAYPSSLGIRVTTNEVACSLEELSRRSSDASWGNRGPGSGREVFGFLLGELIRATSGQSHGIWAEGGSWRPVNEGDLRRIVKERIDQLSPWYQYFDVFGVPTGSIAELNGQDRLAAYCDAMPDLHGLKVVDLGANAGFNSLAFAERGSTVHARESDPRFIDQWGLVASAQPKDLMTRIEYLSCRAESAPLPPHDVCLMGAFHYHLNTNGAGTFRAPERDYEVPLLREPLAVVLEEVRDKGKLLVLGTNWPRLDAQGNDSVVARPEWIVDCLAKMGFRNVRVCGSRGPLTVISAEGLG